MSKIIVIVLAGLIFLSCALTPKVEPQACEADYYRGVYTLCMVLNAQAVKDGASSLIDCNKLVEEASEKGWSDLDAPGFEWPPEQDVGGTSVRR